MSVYLIADIKLTNDAWVPAYAERVHEIVHHHGGRYLARSGNIENVEGMPTDADLIAVIEFPSKQAAENFVADPIYRPFAQARQSGSDSRLRLIDDTDLAGTIAYLRKA